MLYSSKITVLDGVLVQFVSHLIDVILFKLNVYITSTGLRLGT